MSCMNHESSFCSTTVTFLYQGCVNISTALLMISWEVKNDIFQCIPGSSELTSKSDNDNPHGEGFLFVENFTYTA